MKIQLTKKFLACVQSLSAADSAAVDAALADLLNTFGRPHQHAGTSVRPLRRPVYEFRPSLSLRIVFVRSGDVLRVDFVGHHDEVRAYLRNAH